MRNGEKGKKGTGENGKSKEEGRLLKRLKRRSREEAEGNGQTNIKLTLSDMKEVFWGNHSSFITALMINTN